MSEYVKTKYLADNGQIHPIRLTIPYFYWGGLPPEGGLTSRIPAMVTKSTSRHGLRPRGFKLYRVTGVSPNTRIVYGFCPLLTREWYDAPWAAPEVEWEVDGLPWRIQALVPEDYR